MGWVRWAFRKAAGDSLAKVRAGKVRGWGWGGLGSGIGNLVYFCGSLGVWVFWREKCLSIRDLEL